MGFNSETAREAGRATQFVPGDPRRINKPKGTVHLKHLIRKILDQQVSDIDEETGEKLTAEQKIWLVTMRDACAGDKDARRDLANYLYGKPTERVELESKDVDTFTSEQEELTALQMRLAALRNGEDETVEQAQAIVNAD